MALVYYKGKLIDDSLLPPGAMPDGGGKGGSFEDTAAAYENMGGLQIAASQAYNSPYKVGDTSSMSRFDNYGPTMGGAYKEGRAWKGNLDAAGKQVGSWFNANNMNAFGSAVSGLGSLASGWAAMKNLKLTRQAMDTQQDQWNTNFDAQRTTTNNQIDNQNAWKTAQGRTDLGKRIG